MLLAARAGPRNPHVPARTGRRRQIWRRWRPTWGPCGRSLRGRRVGSLINALTLIGLVRGHVPVGVADIHIPCHRVVNMILGQVQQGIPWAPVIWTVTHNADHRGRRAIVDRLGGTCTQTDQIQTARHQHSRCKPHSLHKPGILRLGGVMCTGNTPKSRRSPKAFGAGYALLAQRTAADIETLPDCVKNTALALAFAAVREHEPHHAWQAAR